MMDLYFRFPTEKDAETVLSNFRNEVDWILAGKDYAISVIGIIYKPIDPSLLMDLENPPTSEALFGYHINMRIWGRMEEDHQKIAPFYRIDPPSNPHRVWA
jgi:hypothetical protein